MAAFDFRGVRIVTPPLLVATLGTTMNETELVAVIDALRTDSQDYPGLAFAQRPFVSPATISSIPTTFAGLNGIGNVRAATARSRDRVRSPMETRLRLMLLDVGLPEPEVNPLIELDTGEVIYPDLLWRDQRTIAEYEGEHHLIDERTWSRDIERTRLLERHGYAVLRVTKHHLIEPRFSQLVRDLETALRRRR